MVMACTSREKVKIFSPLRVPYFSSKSSCKYNGKRMVIMSGIIMFQSHGLCATNLNYVCIVVRGHGCRRCLELLCHWCVSRGGGCECRSRWGHFQCIGSTF